MATQIEINQDVLEQVVEMAYDKCSMKTNDVIDVSVISPNVVTFDTAVQAPSGLSVCTTGAGSIAVGRSGTARFRFSGSVDVDTTGSTILTVRILNGATPFYQIVRAITNDKSGSFCLEVDEAVADGDVITIDVADDGSNSQFSFNEAQFSLEWVS